MIITEVRGSARQGTDGSGARSCWRLEETGALYGSFAGARAAANARREQQERENAPDEPRSASLNNARDQVLANIERASRVMGSISSPGRSSSEENVASFGQPVEVATFQSSHTIMENPAQTTPAMTDVSVQTGPLSAMVDCAVQTEAIAAMVNCSAQTELELSPENVSTIRAWVKWIKADRTSVTDPTLAHSVLTQFCHFHQAKEAGFDLHAAANKLSEEKVAGSVRASAGEDGIWHHELHFDNLAWDTRVSNYQAAHQEDMRPADKARSKSILQAFCTDARRTIRVMPHSQSVTTAVVREVRIPESP